MAPFKVPHPLFSVIAHIVDVHDVPVPHNVSRVDEVAWCVGEILEMNDGGFHSPVSSGTSL